MFSRQTRVVIGFLIATLFLSATIGAGWGFIACRRHVRESLDRAYLSSSAFVRAAERWIARGEFNVLRHVSDVMMAGGTQSILLFSESDVFLHLPELPDAQHEPPGSVPPEPSMQLSRSPGGWTHVLLLPFEDPVLRGGARIVMDANAVRSRVAAASFRIAMIMLALWASSAGAAVLFGRRMIRHAPAETPIRIDTGSKQVHLHGLPLPLTPKQYCLMELLVSKPGRLFSEEQILRTVWPDSPYADSNDIRQCIYKIRRKLVAVISGSETCLVNEKGFGYRYVPENLPPSESVKDRDSSAMDGEKGVSRES